MPELKLSTGDIDALKGQAVQSKLPSEVLSRLDWFASYARGNSASEVCREFSIARTTFYLWLERFDPRDLQSLLNEPRTPPAHQKASFRRMANHPRRMAPRVVETASGGAALPVTAPTDVPVLSVSVVRTIPMPSSQVSPDQPEKARGHSCIFCRLAAAFRPSIRTAFFFALFSILGNLLFILFVLFPEHAKASSWNPTLLVNTEAFMTIDDTDTVADPILRFGATLDKTLSYNRTLGQFELNDDLDVKGSLSGASLTISDLKNCNTIDTDGNGHFVCGSDEGGVGGSAPEVGTLSFSGAVRRLGDTKYVRKQGDTMTGTLIIRPAAGASSSGLSVMAIMSGYALRVSGAADVHGLLVASGAIRTETGIVIASDNPAQDAILTFGNNTAAQTIKFMNTTQVFRFSKGISVVGTISGSLVTQNGAGDNYFLGNVGVGTTAPGNKLHVIDSNTNVPVAIQGGANTYINVKAGGVSKGFIGWTSTGDDGLTFLNAGGDTANLLMTDAGNMGIGTTVPETRLEVIGTISGSRLAVTGDGTVTSTGALYVFQSAFATGAMIRNAVANRPVLALDSQGVNDRSAHLMFGYKGTFDTNLFRKAANALRTKGSFEVMGTLSGSSFFGAGLGDCNNTTNSKLIYNASTGKFSCATDQTGGVGSGSAWSNTGALKGAFDLRYVSKQGDTMTGALTIQNGNAHISTTDPMLNVRGAISGSLLRAGNMTVSGAVVYSSGNTLKQTAKGLSGQLLISQGTSAPAWRTPVGGMMWYFNGTQIVGSSLGAQVTLPFGITLVGVTMNIKGAPTGAALIVDIKKDGTSIFGTKPQIDAGYKTGGGGAAFSITTLPENGLMTLDVNQVGSTFAGSGLTVILKGVRSY